MKPFPGLGWNTGHVVVMGTGSEWGQMEFKAAMAMGL